MSLGTRKPKNIAVFISGGGSTLQAFLEYHFQFPIRLIVTNKKDTRGELKAKRFGIPTYWFSKNHSYEDLTMKLCEMKIELIFLAGYMKIVPESFVKSWEGKIFNIHPSLLPAFPGLKSAEKSYESKVPMGVTIHQVNDEMDQGKIFLQQISFENGITDNKVLPYTMTLLRRTEQHLLREFALRKAL